MARRKKTIDPCLSDAATNVLLGDYGGGASDMGARLDAGNFQWDAVDIEVIDPAILPLGGDGAPSPFVWTGHVFDFDVWSVVKGTPNKDKAIEFVCFATKTKPLPGMYEVPMGRPASWPWRWCPSS